MRIGIPKEIKSGEARVGATPDLVRLLSDAGHEVLVEKGAGSRIGFEDQDYQNAGAGLTGSPDEIFACALVVKVKELQAEEYGRLHPGTIVAGYQQLARDPALLDVVLASGITCLAYENVRLPDGSRPLLTPMSIIAGIMSAQIAAWALQRREDLLSGSGILLMGLEGVPPADVLILGDGVAGEAAARAFLRLGCPVTVLGIERSRLDDLERRLGPSAAGRLDTAISTPVELLKRLALADVVIGAVSIPGRLTPKLITRSMLRAMKPRSVLIDIGIDMGGVAETSRQTKLAEPLYLEEGILHYCVPNIPALVPRTATQALIAATSPFIRKLADLGLTQSLEEVPGLREGVLVHDGQVVNRALAEDTGRAFSPVLP